MSKTLVNKTRGSTFRQLLHVSEGVDSTEKQINDGDGTDLPVKVSTGALNVTGQLKLGNTAISATASEINQLDDKVVGGSESDDIVDIGTSQSLDNKTIDGGGYS